MNKTIRTTHLSIAVVLAVAFAGAPANADTVRPSPALVSLDVVPAMSICTALPMQAPFEDCDDKCARKAAEWGADQNPPPTYGEMSAYIQGCKVGCAG